MKKETLSSASERCKYWSCMAFIRNIAYEVLDASPDMPDILRCDPSGPSRNFELRLTESVISSGVPSYIFKAPQIFRPYHILLLHLRETAAVVFRLEPVSLPLFDFPFCRPFPWRLFPIFEKILLWSFAALLV